MCSSFFIKLSLISPNIYSESIDILRYREYNKIVI